MVAALDPDRQIEQARQEHGLSSDIEPTDEQIEQATTSLIAAAVKPLQSNPALRDRLVDAKKRAEMTIDDVSKDEVLEAGFSVEARERAQQITSSFEAFIREHKDEITALQFFYSQPYDAAADLRRHQVAGRDHRQATAVAGRRRSCGRRTRRWTNRRCAGPAAAC